MNDYKNLLYLVKIQFSFLFITHVLFTVIIVSELVGLKVKRRRTTVANTTARISTISKRPPPVPIPELYSYARAFPLN